MEKRSQLSLENEIREELYKDIRDLLHNKYGEVYEILVTDSGLAYRLASPCLDAERNEKTVVVSVTVPRNSKDGTPFDLYEAHEAYKMRMKEHEETIRAREEKKAREEAEKERKRALRKTKKVVKKNDGEN